MRYTFTKRPAKVAAATSKDASRPKLAAVWFDADAGELQATDSYIAARMPVSPDYGDSSGWVPADALERSRKTDAGGLGLNGAAIAYGPADSPDPLEPEVISRLGVASFPRPDLGEPVNLERLWPQDRHGFTVGINAGFLKRLADAIGAADGVVHLTFQEDSSARPDPLRAILVRTSSLETERADGCSGLAAPEGLIMPVRV